MHFIHNLKKRLHTNITSTLILILMGLLLWVPIQSVQADVGPKPSMDFEFDYRIEKVPIIEGKLMQCDDEKCSTWRYLEHLGPQDFTCQEYSCSSLAYGYSDYHKLVIKFEDQERESNIFTKDHFSARYTVKVFSNSLEVKETGGSGRLLAPCTGSIGLTLVLETLLASIYLTVFRLPKSLLGWVPVASMITLPFVWFAFPHLSLSSGWITGLSETFAVGIETFFLYFISGRNLPLRHAAVLSLAMNACSFGLGLFVG